MRGTGPLAIDHFVKVVGGRNISRFHSYLSARYEKPHGLFSLPASALPALLWFSNGIVVLPRIRAIQHHAQRQICESVVFHRLKYSAVNGVASNAALQHKADPIRSTHRRGSSPFARSHINL